MEDIRVVVTVDTEEDDWGTYEEAGATAENIRLLPLLQERIDRFGAKATYLVNWPPLHDVKAAAVLRELAARADVEIGTHCHMWNTPPYTGAGEARSMMWMFPLEVLAAKLRNLTDAIEDRLGVRPRAFRSGKWGFGTSVALAMQEEGYRVDSSVTPFIDWSEDGGPDYSLAPQDPYPFDPLRPLVPDPEGPIVEVPATVGFLRGAQARASRLRRGMEDGLAGKLGVVGLLDRSGWLTRRWLSPEGATGAEMVRLADTVVGEGGKVLVMSLHSSTMLPGATPFVRSEEERHRFLGAIDTFLTHCRNRGFRFSTLSQAAESVGARRVTALVNGQTPSSSS